MPVTYSIFTPGKTWIYRIDPRAKFVWLISGFILTITFNNPFYIIFLFLLTLLIAVTARLNWSTVRVVIGSSILFLVFGMVMWPFYFEQGPTLFMLFGNNITRDGMLFGVASGMRVGVMIAIATVWISTTSPQDITTAMIKMGVPVKAASTVTLALRFVPMMRGEITTIMEAQRSRCLDFRTGNILNRAKKYIPIVVPVFMRAFMIAQQLGIALDAKGFGSTNSFTILNDIKMARKDYLFAGVWLLLLLSGFVLRYLGFGVLAKGLL